MNILMPGTGANEGPHAIAISPDDRHWLLLNASAELVREARLQERGAIAAVVLLDGRFEHTAGLAALCGGAPLDVYTTPGVFEGLAEAAPTLGLLHEHCTLRWHLLPIAGDVRSADFQVPGLEALRCRALAADEQIGFGERIVLEVDDRLTGQCLSWAGGQEPCWTDDGHARRGHGT